MNAKKIIKGIVKLGVMGGIAYAAYKLGECNGEVNERMREKYGDEDEDGIGSDDDEEEADNYYGTCFEPKYVEPDDGCLAPASVAVTPYNIGKEHIISEVVSAEKCEVPDEPHEKEKPLPQKENSFTTTASRPLFKGYKQWPCALRLQILEINNVKIM